MASKEELACVYAALILQDDEVAITGEKISTILKAAGVDVEPFWRASLQKALEGVDIKGLITNISSGVGVGGGVSAQGGGVVASESGGGDKAAEEAKESKEESESEDEDMGFGLFD